MGRLLSLRRRMRGFPRPAWSLSILPVHIFRVKLQFSRLPDKPVQVAGHSVKDSGVLEFYEVIMLGDHSWSLKVGPTDCPETSVRNATCSLCKSPEERKSHLLRGGSLTPRSYHYHYHHYITSIIIIIITTSIIITIVLAFIVTTTITNPLTRNMNVHYSQKPPSTALRISQMKPLCTFKTFPFTTILSGSGYR